MESYGHKCVGFCEADKFARKTYKAIHETEGEIELHDIKEVTDEQWRELRGQVDIITGGFPCQSFSTAGRRKGFKDKTRGTMFFELMRATEQIQPSLLIFENVKGLLYHDGGNTFRTVLQSMDELGYDVEWEVLNSKDFYTPQNRERIFIVGHSRKGRRREIFPIRRYGASSNEIKQVGNISKTGERDKFSNNPHTGRVYDSAGLSPTINTMGGGGREPKIFIDGRIRKLTPKECWRLQTIPDWAFDKAQEVTSKSQLYKQAGNTITINVAKAIIEKITILYGKNEDLPKNSI